MEIIRATSYKSSTTRNAGEHYALSHSANDQTVHIQTEEWSCPGYRQPDWFIYVLISGNDGRIGALTISKRKFISFTHSSALERYPSHQGMQSLADPTNEGLL